MWRPRNLNKSGGRLVVPLVGATALTGGFIYYRAPSKNAATGGQAERTRQKRDKEALSGAGVGGNATSGGHETGQVGSGVQPGTGDKERTPVTTAESRDQLPSGGVGGGVGGGGANVRSIEMSSKGDVQNDMKNIGSSSSTPKLETTNKDSSSAKQSQKKDNDSALQSRAGSNSQSEPQRDSSDKQVAGSSYPTSSSDHKPTSGITQTDGTSISQRLQSAFGQGGKSTAEPGGTKKKFDDPRVHSNDAETPTKRGQMRSNS